jgi:hypothetical protein
MLRVPGCWEAQGFDRRCEGPTQFRRRSQIPAEWRDHRIQLQFDAVSYYAEVQVNGVDVGTHTGLWPPFAFDVTQVVRPGEDNEISLTVFKPGERFPVRESLAGFLPDVALIFGGIWQSARLVAFPGASLSDLSLLPNARTGEVQVSAKVQHREGLSGSVHILAPDGNVVAQWKGSLNSDSLAATILVDGAKLWERQWQPDNPVLYTAEIGLEDGHGGLQAQVRRTFGFRELRSIQGEWLALNVLPICLRGVLNWGWYPDILCPAPDEATIRDEFRRVRELGFNMIKLCLYVPSPLYFDIADEEGMLLWLELPMWLPRVTSHLRRQAPLEYADILATVHHHPSVVIYSLGCELNQTVEADFIAELNEIVRAQVRGALVCDNSGSGEAYGGAFDFADFNDYHFYSDLQYFDPLVDHFSRDWRSPRPWIFGEFCDADDYRDLSVIEAAHSGQLPWWLTEWNALHRREFVGYPEQKPRMERLNLDEKGLIRISRQQSFVVRKTILEKVRARAGMGGYVVTGIKDTPLATSAVFDDLNQSKYTHEEFKTFNADTVLLIRRGRTRQWVRGGDQPAPFEPYSFVAGQRIHFELIVSPTGAPLQNGTLTWEARNSDGHILGAGTQRAALILPAPRPSIMGHITFDAPQTDDAMTLQLDVTLKYAGHTIRNSWPLWVFPAVTQWPQGIALVDPTGSLTGLDDLWETAQEVALSDAPLIITSALTEDVVSYLRKGGSVLLIQHGNNPLPARPCPFWREAIKLIGDHPVMNAFPHTGFVDMQFYGLATDWAFDVEQLLTVLSDAVNLRFPLRRLDARQFTLLDYIIEAQVGAGHLLATTLRLQGGLGDQPLSLRGHVAGRWLLHQFLKSLNSPFTK